MRKLVVCYFVESTMLWSYRGEKSKLLFSNTSAHSKDCDDRLPPAKHGPCQAFLVFPRGLYEAKGECRAALVRASSGLHYSWNTKQILRRAHRLCKCWIQHNAKKKVNEIQTQLDKFHAKYKVSGCVGVRATAQVSQEIVQCEYWIKRDDMKLTKLCLWLCWVIMLLFTMNNL